MYPSIISILVSEMSSVNKVDRQFVSERPQKNVLLGILMDKLFPIVVVTVNNSERRWRNGLPQRQYERFGRVTFLVFG